MAPWSDAKLFFCIFIITCSCAVFLLQMPVDWFINVTQKKMEICFVVDYSHQIAEQGSPINAVIHGKKLCVCPEQSWVKEITKHVDELKKVCKEHNYKLKRCFGVNRE